MISTGEERADVSIVYDVKQLSVQLNPIKPKLIAQETAKDQVLSKVQCYTKEGWPSKLSDEIEQFKKLKDSLLLKVDVFSTEPILSSQTNYVRRF